MGHHSWRRCERNPVNEAYTLRPEVKHAARLCTATTSAPLSYTAWKLDAVSVPANRPVDGRIRHVSYIRL